MKKIGMILGIVGWCILGINAKNYWIFILGGFLVVLSDSLI